MFQSIIGIVILTIGLASCRPEDGRIVNGTNAVEGKYCFMMAVEYIANGFVFCGASLISPRWAATAAHCVYKEDPKDIAVRYMVTELNSTAFIKLIEKIHTHGNFSPPSYFANDIAMMKFKNDLFYYSPKICPVLLPHREFKIPTKEGDFLEGLQLGWGMNASDGAPQNHLQEVRLKIRSHADCHRIMSGHTTSDQICSGVDGGGKGACHGDSGGPLVIINGTKYMLIGITSFGFGKCGNNIIPASVSTNVVNYVPWMLNIMNFF